MALLVKNANKCFVDFSQTDAHNNDKIVVSYNEIRCNLVSDIVPTSTKKTDIVQRCRHIYGINKICQRAVLTGTNRCGFHANK